MSKEQKMTLVDGNLSCANVAYMMNEVIAIYPITPSSPMAEHCDAYSAAGRKNIFGAVPSVIEMQSEGGAAGAVHGSITSGALTTTFTASQGLLLMIPNMYKIAGELSCGVIHVAARALATQALSIFGDHGDVLAARATGFALLASANVQEAQDFAAIAQMATLETRIPFVHFFDGFRTSHEVAKIIELSDDQCKELIDQKLVAAHKERGLSPDTPSLRGTSQNPDVYFQGREVVNKYYDAAPAKVQAAMDKFATVIGRQYKCFEYVGDPKAERVVIAMASGCDVAQEYVDYATKKGEKIGVLKVRLFRPFDKHMLIDALPKSVRAIAVLERTKEPGSMGEPMYVDIRTAVGEIMIEDKMRFDRYPVIVGGRYGLGSKEFTPAMVKAVYDNLKQDLPKNHFTVGINDDVTNTSLPYDASFDITDKATYSAVFFGLGSDGTVGANKNSIKVIGDLTENYGQGYFVYDSKKAGTVTISHLRFGPKPIRSPYLVSQADFVACHNESFLDRLDVLKGIKEGGTFLINALVGPEEVWNILPKTTQQIIIDRKIKVYTIDAVHLAKKLGLEFRINTIMQTVFFDISKILTRDVFVKALKDAIKKTYGSKGEKVVNMNCAAVDEALTNYKEVKVPGKADSSFDIKSPVPVSAPAFVREVEGTILQGRGDDLPVSKIPVDGTFPTATTQYEKRNIAFDIPEWDPELCIQCGQCSLVCPHAVIRMKIYDPSVLAKAPATFKNCDAKTPAFAGKKFSLQISPGDCTSCATCVAACPAKSKTEEGRKAINMIPVAPVRQQETENFEFFLTIPETDPSTFNQFTTKGSQLKRPLFEFSGACAGCGETPYVKLLSQLYGDHMMVANATGCSSIYGGNLPTTPYCVNAEGYGPAWSNSLFEDNAEFGLGMRLAVDSFIADAMNLVNALITEGHPAKAELEKVRDQDQSTQAGIGQQRANVMALKQKLADDKSEHVQRLITLLFYLVKKSVWIIGGDGWAYDIGYGGLDHVMASGKNVNVLVLDTEVYSNTGGQMSKSTPLGAVAAFAAGGKPAPKKDLVMMMMSYGNVYVARIALGANPTQAVKAFSEAEAYKGPSIIIAYTHCVNHGLHMANGLEQQKKAVESGHWVLCRYNPDLEKEGKNPLQLDSKAPSIKLEDYVYGENRYRRLKQSKPEVAQKLIEEGQKFVTKRAKLYQDLAQIKID
ncbi:MAG: pyruvate:ferredoxin (flavodoxin) oxidoreductase [Candidatus Omnitrophica bacterium]|nr:pyruvate:ferredoxin (flavodoxin) oxidoreductase [Candidatus Omnitrophota bacterium]